MKKILLYIAACLFVFIGCEKIDSLLDTTNYQKADTSSFPQTEKDAEQLAKLLNWPVKPGNSSVFAGAGFECMKEPGRGKNGHVAIATAVQADLSVLGIEMTIEQVDWNVFLEERKAGNYDMARNGWIADFNDPINMLEMWTTTSGNNDIQYGRIG